MDLSASFPTNDDTGAGSAGGLPALLAAAEARAAATPTAVAQTRLPACADSIEPAFDAALAAAIATWRATRRVEVNALFTPPI